MMPFESTDFPAAMAFARREAYRLHRTSYVLMDPVQVCLYVLTGAHREFLQGRQIVTVAKPGDHVVVTRFDRCFRSMRDFVNTFRLLETRGIILRQQGKHTGGKPPWGYKVVGPRSNPAKGVKGNRRLEPDWEERALMLEIVRLGDLERIPCWETISARMRQMQRDARRAGIDNPRSLPPGVVLGKLPASLRGLLDRAGREGRYELDRRSDDQEPGGCPLGRGVKRVRTGRLR